MVGRAVAARQKRESGLLKRVIGFSLLGLAILLGVMVVPGVVRSLAPVAPATSEQPQAPKADPGVVMPPRTDLKPRVASADPLLAQVQELRRRLALAAQVGWAALERESAALAGQVGEGTPAARELSLVQQQLADDAEAWYKSELAKLPPSGQQTVGARLNGLSRLRDEAGTAERLDADVRYQEELATLMQRLNDVRRQARRALEAGRIDELAKLAGDLAPAFADTPFSAVQRQFALHCSEAAGLTALWKTDWRTTAIGFERQRGERALAAGSALLLIGDPKRAKRVLLADPQLATGSLMRRREALMGGLAAVLTFDEPADMQFLDVTSGEPVLGGGVLRGSAGQATSLGSTVLVGGADWLSEVVLSLASPEAEVVISCMAQGEPVLLVRLAEGALLSRLGADEQTAPVSVSGQRRLRLSCRGGRLLVVLDGREVARFERTAVPAESQLRLDLAGSDWTLDEMQVVGGR